MVDLDILLSELSRFRPIFHSEADFQHALAWRLHEQHPEFAVWLEYRARLAGERMHVDIWATAGQRILAVEVKYKQRRLQVTVNGESFDLTDQSATGYWPLRRD